MSASKQIEGKPPVELVPPAGIIAEAFVFGYGVVKYGRGNWRKGIKYSHHIGATLRHVYAFMRGEDVDPESGLHHLWHAKTNLAILIASIEDGLGEDDRLTD